MTAPTLSQAVLRLKPARGWTAEYITHQLVADIFGDRTDRGYLYRTTRERPGGVEVLVLSPSQPLTMNELPVRDWGAVIDLRSKSFVPPISPGQRLDFEVRINATRVITEPNGKKRRADVWEAAWRADRNTPCTPHEIYREYVSRKLEGAALIHDVRATERGEVRAKRGDRGSAVRFVAANLIGTLSVVEPARFLELVAEGIGREKAFGCGLICLSAPGSVLARRYPGVAAELY
jgi:CRISPR system Cascade subunit CasE